MLKCVLNLNNLQLYQLNVSVVTSVYGYEDIVMQEKYNVAYVFVL